MRQVVTNERMFLSLLQEHVLCPGWCGLTCSLLLWEAWRRRRASLSASWGKAALLCGCAAQCADQGHTHGEQPVANPQSSSLEGRRVWGTETKRDRHVRTFSSLWILTNVSQSGIFLYYKHDNQARNLFATPLQWFQGASWQLSSFCQQPQTGHRPVLKQLSN